jgi:hypothetical protein
MWLFTGRYGNLGPLICTIALGIAAIGSAFIVIALRRVKRSDIREESAFGAILALMAGAVFGGELAYGEQVFVSNRLNEGAALFVAIIGILLGASGVVISIKRRLLGILFLVTAAGILLGGVVGWIWRTTGPSKYG